MLIPRQRSLSSDFAPVVPLPPANEAPIGEKGQHSQAWGEFFQKNSDLLNELTKGMRLVGIGITDGSDADPGHIGEVLTASGSVSLSAFSMATVATLSLTAGDWDVVGQVTFNITGSTASRFGVGFDGGFTTQMIVTVPTGSGVWQLSGGPVRRNVTATTSVALSALCGFSGGAVSADGFVRARRMR